MPKIWVNTDNLQNFVSENHANRKSIAKRLVKSMFHFQCNLLKSGNFPISRRCFLSECIILKKIPEMFLQNLTILKLYDSKEKSKTREGPLYLEVFEKTCTESQACFIASETSI